MRILRKQSIGLIIDIQQRLFPHIHGGEALSVQTQRLLKAFDILSVPYIVTEQYPKGLGYTLPIIVEAMSEYKPLVKSAFSCCDDSGFQKHLHGQTRKNVIIAGIETHVCVMQTAIDLLANGYQPVVVADCVSSRNANDKELALQRMQQHGAIITSFESIVFELARYSGTPEFKLISSLVK